MSDPSVEDAVWEAASGTRPGLVYPRLLVDGNNVSVPGGGENGQEGFGPAGTPTPGEEPDPIASLVPNGHIKGPNPMIF